MSTTAVSTSTTSIQGSLGGANDDDGGLQRGMKSRRTSSLLVLLTRPFPNPFPLSQHFDLVSCSRSFHDCSDISLSRPLVTHLVACHTRPITPTITSVQRQENSRLSTIRRPHQQRRRQNRQRQHPTHHLPRPHLPRPHLPRPHLPRPHLDKDDQRAAHSFLHHSVIPSPCLHLQPRPHRCTSQSRRFVFVWV